MGEFAKQTADGGLDIIRSLEALNRAMGGMTALERGRFLQEKGFEMRSATGVALLAEKAADLYKIAGATAEGYGVAAQKAAERADTFAFRMAILHNNVSELWQAMGNTLLPGLTELSMRAVAFAQAANRWAAAHPGIMKLIAGATALSAAILLPLGSLLVFAGGLVVALSYTPQALAGLSTLTTGVTALSGAFLGAGKAAAVFLFTTPLGWMILAAAAVGAAAYAVYAYWDEIKAGFSAGFGWISTQWSKFGDTLSGYWDSVKASFGSFLDWITGWGDHLLGWVQTHWAQIGLAMLGPVGWMILAVSAIDRNWDVISAGAADAWSAVTGATAAAGTWLAAMPGRLAAVASQSYAAVVGWLRDVPAAYLRAGMDAAAAGLDWITGLPGRLGSAGASLLAASLAWVRTLPALLVDAGSLAAQATVEWMSGVPTAIAGWASATAAAAHAWIGVVPRTILDTLRDMFPHLYDAGAEMLKMLGRGIASAALWPLNAVAGIAAKVKDYFVGHSPPPVGPLRELGRVRIVETIAEMLNPEPLVAAARRVAAAAAIALPISVMPSMAAAALAPYPSPLPVPAVAPLLPPAMPVPLGIPPAVPAPSVVTPVLPAPSVVTPVLPARLAVPGLPAAERQRLLTINVTYAPTINAGGRDTDDLKRLLDDHKRDLLDTIEREQRRAERVAY